MTVIEPMTHHLSSVHPGGPDVDLSGGSSGGSNGGQAGSPARLRPAPASRPESGSPSQRQCPGPVPVPNLQQVPSERVARAWAAYTTRHVLPLQHGELALLHGEGATPCHGDLVLAEVTEVGQHQRIELPDGRRATLRPGDEVVVAYGARYAPDQFEAYVPEDLGPCDLVAAGGVAGRVESSHDRMAAPTRLRPAGLLADAAGARLRLADWARVTPREPAALPGVTTVAVVGTSMNAGKTSVATELVAGLVRAGLRVGATKITGTGAGGDPWRLNDAGAEVLDFTDAGYPTTFTLAHEECVRVAGGLHAALAATNDVVVIEIADGLLQAETDRLLRDRRIAAVVDGLVFAAGDALGAIAGAERLGGLGWRVLGTSGRFTSSPLAVEEASAGSAVPVWSTFDLAEPAMALGLLAPALDAAA